MLVASSFTTLFGTCHSHVKYVMHISYMVRLYKAGDGDIFLCHWDKGF